MDEDAANRIQSLRDTVVLRLRDLELLAARIIEAWPRAAAEGEMAVLGVGQYLNAYYTILERLFEAIARIDGSLDKQLPDWHKQLLEQMTLERNAMRPPIIGEDLRKRLSELLGFRHLFRNAYYFPDLDVEKVHALVEKLPSIHADVVASLNEFSTFLEQLAAT